MLDVMNTVAALNFNPLNLRPLPSGEMWQGQTGVSTYAGSGAFCRFKDNTYGVRAAVLNMRSIVRLGARTLKAVIQTWTGTKDQPQSTIDNYLQHVANKAGVSTDYDLGWLAYSDGVVGGYEADKLANIITGMNEYEAGGPTVSKTDIFAGINMALKLKVGYERMDDGNIVRTNVEQSGIVKSADKGMVGTVVTVATGVVVPTVTAVVGAPPITVAIIVGAFLVVLGGLALYYFTQVKNKRVGANNDGTA
jgi:hypothetical protein